MPTRFSCRVLISREHGKLGNAVAGFFKGMMRGVERVAFDDPEFERRYEVYADDPAAARELMVPAFLETMVALADIHGKKLLGAAFADGDFLLAIPMKRDLFEPDSVRQSVFDCQGDIHEFLDQVTIPYRVVDHLHGDRPDVSG